MSRLRSRDPVHFCPVCGVNWNKHPRAADSTKDLRNGPCNPSVLRGIDAANTRAARSDDIASDKAWYPEPRDYHVRLRDGFRMMGAGA